MPEPSDGAGSRAGRDLLLFPNRTMIEMPKRRTLFYKNWKPRRLNVFSLLLINMYPFINGMPSTKMLVSLNSEVNYLSLLLIRNR